MKLSRLVLLSGALWLCAALSASESYMVVRLVDPERRDFLVRSGAVQMQHPDLRPDEVLVFVTETQLGVLQNEPNVALVYPASVELVAGVPVHACTPPESDLIAQFVQNVGRGWGPGKNRLTYSVESSTPKLGKERMLAGLQQALAQWSKYVQIDFTPTDTTDASRNLNIVFASGPHGDPYPFDGRGRALAHTFYPADVNPEPIAGDLHFDEDENWGNGVDPDFYSVVLHEIGHALGLGHSDRPNAVMYPYYRRFETLLPEDIAAVRRLYPARNESISETANVNSPAPSTPAPAPPAPTTPTPAPVPPVLPAPRSGGSDTTAPTLRVVTPAMTISSTSAATARISGTAVDADGVSLVSWSASGGRSGVATGTTVWSIDVPLRPGDNVVIVRAFDSVGNTAWRSLTITRR